MICGQATAEARYLRGGMALAGFDGKERAFAGAGFGGILSVPRFGVAATVLISGRARGLRSCEPAARR